MPGPAPKPDSQRRRRNAAPPTMRLPSAGRSGPVPAWPLDGSAPSPWPKLWKLPQAVAWERLHLIRVVARYALLLQMAEAGDRYAWPEVRQLEDRLGLSPMSMLRLRWEVDDADDAPKPAAVRSLNDYRDAI